MALESVCAFYQYLVKALVILLMLLGRSTGKGVSIIVKNSKWISYLIM
ncbi:MAG: hypothetical protein LBI72_03175 [Flavobacteriaceae bacterium]|jgi:hypothetical protein|nr:hypothetical protein [Flavobacteriaceae bacterium]